VYQILGRDGSRHYLKHGRGAVAADIASELVRLQWLADKSTVPAMEHFVATLDDAWLLTKALPGVTAYEALQSDRANRSSIVAALASFLRRFHAIAVDGCPFNSDHRVRLSQARERLAAGLIETDDFDQERRGSTADQAWDLMIGLLPITVDPVLTHGDLSLDNILVQGAEVSGLVDLGRVGVADRYQDLAILWRDLGEFDGTLQQRLLDSYGIDAVDERKLRFHRALDEFF
jgi:aminoglycoside 3'-phosphotransferase-1